jgi:hypothetical protein
MTPIESLLNNVAWEKTNQKPEGDLPYATHSGVLKIGDIELRCYRLSTGQAVFNAEDFEALFGVL